MAYAISHDAEIKTVYEACALVDELGATSTGEVVVSRDGDPLGAVFLERGRVCWAAARGLARRLTELLVARSTLSPDQMEATFAACKAGRIPLGEHLVNRGALRGEDLRSALLQHTVESLAFLCKGGARAGFHARPGGGYSPKFTFQTAELVAHAGALSHGTEATRARAVMNAIFAPGEWAAAFARPLSSAFPEPVALYGDVPNAATTLLRFGKWAASALDVASTFTDDGALLTVSRGPRGASSALVAFRSEGIVVMGETGALGPARIMNRRAQQRRSKAHGAL